MTTRTQKTKRETMIENITRWMIDITPQWTREDTINDLKLSSDAQVFETYQRLQRAYGLPQV